MKTTATVSRSQMPTVLKRETAKLIMSEIDPVGYGYDVPAWFDGSEKAKARFMRDTFKKEFWEGQQRYYGYDVKKAFTSWMQGLPFCSVPFSNFDILELAKSWGIVGRSEEAEDRIIAAYWESLGHAFLFILSMNKIYFND